MCGDEFEVSPSVSPVNMSELEVFIGLVRAVYTAATASKDFREAKDAMVSTLSVLEIDLGKEMQKVRRCEI